MDRRATSTGGRSAVRYLTFCSLLIVAASVSGFAVAQDATPEDGPALSREATTAPMSLSSLTAKFDRLEDQLVNTERQLQSMTAANMDLQSQVEALTQKVESLARSMGEMVADDGTSGPRMNLLGNMEKSENFREDFRSATQGRLVINNFTGMPQLLYINGNVWQVRTNESYIWVPLGVVSIQRSVSDEPTFVTDWNFKKNEDPRTRGKVPYYSEAHYDLRLGQ